MSIDESLDTIATVMGIIALLILAGTLWYYVIRPGKDWPK